MRLNFSRDVLGDGFSASIERLGRVSALFAETE